MSILVKEKSFDKELFNSRLEFEISGKDVDYVLVNTMRRFILSEIPTFIFDDFEIIENTSVFNNNQLKLYLKNIPLVGIKNIPLKYKKKKLEEEEAEEDEELQQLVGNNEAELDTEEEPIEDSSLESLTMYLDFINNSEEIVSVTTDNAKFYYMGREIKSPYPNPVVLVKLQPKQKIKLTAKSVLGIEKEDGKYSPVAVCAYNEINDNKFTFFLESRGQLTEKEIIKRACYQINRKLSKLKKIFPQIKLKDGEIKIPKERHTMGNLISHGLELLPETSYSTYYQKHSLDNEIFIKFGFSKEQDVKKLIEKVCEKYSKLYKDIESKF